MTRTLRPHLDTGVAGAGAMYARATLCESSLNLRARGCSQLELQSHIKKVGSPQGEDRGSLSHANLPSKYQQQMRQE